MVKDFTLDILEILYAAYLKAGYTPVTVEDYFTKGSPTGKTIIFRHDIDAKPGNALNVAKVQHKMGVRGTFYFRILPHLFDTHVIREVISLGHEIGYHYEDMDICKGDLDKAAEHFKKTLEKFRELYPVKTVCMHGSPLSRWDNKELWKKIDYKTLGIIGEPYLDIDFSNGLYLTDTGHTWNGDAYSIRDRIKSGRPMRFTTTHQIIDAIDHFRMPSFIMQNFHPQRWTNDPVEWMSELLTQRIKNVAKFALRKIRK
jgi:hypothetical protein